MYGQRGRAAGAYQQTQVQSSSPLELVVLLYDGALRHLAAARDAMVQQNLTVRRSSLSRTLAIVTELQTTLNLKDGGTVAESLDSLYTYIIGRLLDANIRHDADAITEVERLMRSLRDAWAQIAAQPAEVQP